MKFSLHEKRLGHLIIQRNLFFGLFLVLLVMSLLLTILLFFKRERIIISPPELKQSYWVEGNQFSNSYIEEMALFFVHLMMDVSEKNILLQGEVLLRYVLPESYGDFKGKILDDEKRLKKQQLTLHFEPQHPVEILEPMVVHISGILKTYIASRKVSQHYETYELKFVNRKGCLFLESFKTIKSDQENFDDNMS